MGSDSRGSGKAWCEAEGLHFRTPLLCHLGLLAIMPQSGHCPCESGLNLACACEKSQGVAKVTRLQLPCCWPAASLSPCRSLHPCPTTRPGWEDPLRDSHAHGRACSESPPELCRVSDYPRSAEMEESILNSTGFVLMNLYPASELGHPPFTSLTISLSKKSHFLKHR